MSKLTELLKKTAEKNEFYKNKIKEYQITDPTDITQYPVLTRQELQENRYNMFYEQDKNLNEIVTCKRFICRRKCCIKSFIQWFC